MTCECRTELLTEAYGNTFILLYSCLMLMDSCACDDLRLVFRELVHVLEYGSGTEIDSTWMDSTSDKDGLDMDAMDANGLIHSHLLQLNNYLLKCPESCSS
jgi:hypothetical protein